MNGPWGQDCFVGWGDLLFMVDEKVLSFVFCGELELFMVHEKVFYTGVCGELELFMVCDEVFCIAVLWGASTVCGRWESILHWCCVGSWNCLWYVRKYSALVFCGELVLFVVGEKVFCTGVVWGAGTVYGMWESILQWCFVGRWYCLWEVRKYSTLVLCGELELFMVCEKVFCIPVLLGGDTVCGRWESILYWRFVGSRYFRGKALTSDLEGGQSHCRYYLLTSPNISNNFKVSRIGDLPVPSIFKRPW